MKHMAQAVAVLFRTRSARRAQDDDASAAAPWPQPAPSREPTVRILCLDHDQGVPEEGPVPPGSPQAYFDDLPMDTVRLYLLGIAIILYLLALMFSLFR